MSIQNTHITRPLSRGRGAAATHLTFGTSSTHVGCSGRLARYPVRILRLLPEPTDKIPRPVEKRDDFDFGLSDFVDEAIRGHEDFADGRIL